MATSVNIGDDLKSYLTSSQGPKTNPVSKLFGGSTSKVSGWFYSPLSNEDDSNGQSNGAARNGVNGQSGTWGAWFKRSEPEPDNSCLPALSRTQRLIGFACCLGMGIVCFFLASFYIPLLLIKARKFSLLFTLGSAFILLSFSFLSGPWNHVKHLFSKERLPFTLSYVGSLTGTLYCAVHMQNTILTCLFAIIQVIALLWYVFSYIPGGTSGLWFMSKMVAGSASRSLPV